jgi:hypothetical protein
MEKEMLLGESEQQQLLELVLEEAEVTALVEMALLVKFGLGTESNGLFCKYRLK